MEEGYRGKWMKQHARKDGRKIEGENGGIFFYV
jgi:hypothetical protein